MEQGILNYVKDFVWKSKATDGVAMSVVPTGNISMSGEAIRPGDLASQLKAFKGTVYACSDLIGLGVGANPLRVYATLNGREKSNFKLTETKAVSTLRKDEMFAKATPGTSLSRAADVEEVVNGPLVDLLRNVNGYMNAFDAKKLTSVNMDLTGNAYWVLLRNDFGLPAAIWFVPSAYMSVIPGDKDWIKGYRYKKGTKKIDYPLEDIIHFKCVSPLSQYYGVAPLLACLDAYQLREYMMNFEQQAFKTGGNMKMIVYVKGADPGEKGADQIKKRIQRIGDNEPAVVGGDDMEFVFPPSASARDMGFRDGLSFARDDIAMVLHVPKSMLTADDVNRATASAQKYHLAEYAIQPRCIQIDEKLSEKLAPQFDPRYVIVFDNSVPEDIEQAREDRKVNIELGITSRDEERAAMNLPPKGFDDLRLPTTFTGGDENEVAERVAADAWQKAIKLKDEWRYGRGNTSGADQSTQE